MLRRVSSTGHRRFHARHWMSRQRERKRKRGPCDGNGRREVEVEVDVDVDVCFNRYFVGGEVKRMQGVWQHFK